jgi:hypothetical protein
MTLSVVMWVVANIAGGRILYGGYTKTCAPTIMAANTWKSSLKNVESDNNKILCETLLDFLQRNSTYFLNKPRIYGYTKCWI